jgi:alpha-tubulin suppressor-like RCC1 family protein
VKKIITRLTITIATGLILLLAACGSVENGNYANGAGLNAGAHETPPEYETPPVYEAAPTPSPTPRPVAPPEIMGLHPPAPDEEIHPSLTPSQPLNLPIIQSTVSAGHSLSVVLDEEGSVWFWGGYYPGSLPVRLAPQRRDYSAAAVFVDRNFPSFYMICEAGYLYSHQHRWDENIAYFRRLIHVRRPAHGVPPYRSMTLYRNGRVLLSGGTTRAIYGDPQVIAATLGETHILLLAYDYNLFSVGSGLATGVPNHLMGVEPVLIMGNVAQIAAETEHSMALTHDNRLYAWGRNGDGRVGNGSRTSAQRSVFIMDNVIAISVGDSSSFAITSDGVLYGWGCNRYGQLGIENDNPTVPSHTRPVAIMENIALVSAGVNHTLAVTHDGVLYAWGNNAAGQLGDGTTYSQTTPIRIMEGVKQT